MTVIFDRPQTTVVEALRNSVEKWGDKIAFDFSGETLTFRQVDQRSNMLAHGLAALGVGRGDRVCSLLDNSPEQACLLFAVAKLGAVSVPLNAALRGEFLRHQIADSGARLIVSEAHYAERIFAIEDGAPHVAACVVRGGCDAPSTRLALHDLEAIMGSDGPVEALPVSPGDLALVLYTSGTTGPSKGCMIGHNHFCNTGYLIAKGGDVEFDDIFWTPLPLFHMGAAGALIGCVQIGATIAVAPQFSVSNFWPEVERSKATIVLIISIMLKLVADAPDNEVSRRCHGQLRAVLGVPFPAALIARWKSRFGVRHAGATGYGMTEATPNTFASVTEIQPDGASGRRLEQFEVEVVDEDDNILPVGQTGQVVVRPRKPNTLFMGYWQRPEATVEAWRNLWFHTGDLGRFDDNGYFYFVDRAKDYLRRGGENISSFEMEMTFRAHPAIEDVAVHAVPSDKAEDEVKVTAILREGASLGEEELCRWSLERVPHYAVPRYIEFCHDLPRNASGRVLKYELRQRGVSTATWDRATSGIRIAKR
jgi:crotonobetaine/carnitine-CoA ligase